MITAEKYIELLHARAAAAGTPLAGTFELTSRCDLDCRMCYIHRREFDGEALASELSAERWCELAREAAGAGMLTLLLTGGEPFVRRDLQEIYAYCHGLGLLLSVNTNGTLIGPDELDWLSRMPPQKMSVTLYGASAATYERLCGSGEAYGRALSAILGMKAAGVPVKLNFSAVPENIGDMSAVIDFARRQDLPLQLASYMFPPIRARESGPTDVHRLTPEQAARVQLQYDASRFSPEEYRKRREKILAGAPVEPDGDECRLDQPTERIRCRAGKTTFWITGGGEMRPCGMMSEPSVSLKDGFLTAWREIMRLREEIVVPAKCSACKNRTLCGACPAASFSENGRYDLAPEYLCRKTEAYIKLLKDEGESGEQ